MRINIPDKYIQGTASFEKLGGFRARIAYVKYSNLPRLPLGTVYSINDEQWKVINTLPSLFNDNVINVDLERVF